MNTYGNSMLPNFMTDTTPAKKVCFIVAFIHNSLSIDLLNLANALVLLK